MIERNTRKAVWQQTRVEINIGAKSARKGIVKRLQREGSVAAEAGRGEFYYLSIASRQAPWACEGLFLLTRCWAPPHIQTLNPYAYTVLPFRPEASLLLLIVPPRFYVSRIFYFTISYKLFAKWKCIVSCSVLFWVNNWVVLIILI